MLGGLNIIFLIVVFLNLSFEQPLIVWKVMVEENRECYVPLHFVSGPEFDCHKTDYQKDSYNETHVSFHIYGIAQCDALIDNVVRSAYKCSTFLPSVVAAPSLSGASLQGKLLKTNETFG